MPGISGRAYAKVNLGLRILDKRSDGFHELRTVYQTISLFDRLRLTWTPGSSTRISIRCDRAELATDENLAVRAADLLLRETRKRGELEIGLMKRIPSGAGLGGGSSDAAATLVGLSRLIEAALPMDALQGIAAELGSDVPFFLQGGRAVGVGRGEEVYPLPEPPRQWLVVVAPRLHSSTRQAYRDLAQSRPARLTEADKRRILNVFGSGVRVPGARDAQSLAGVLANDFEDVIFGRFPHLAEIKSRLRTVGACDSALSGSGSALFGLFAAKRAAQDARNSMGGMDGEVFVVSTVTRRGCAAAWRESD